MKPVSPLCAFFLLLVSANLASGFVGVHLPQPMTTKVNDGAASRLYVASPFLDSEITERMMSLQELPTKNALPFRREGAQQEEALLDVVEVGIGRLAMVAALVFCAVEVTTGMSLPEQIARLSALS